MRRIKSRRHRWGVRLRLEHLEPRTLPSSYTAATAADLLAALSASNTAGGTNTIALIAPSTSAYVLSAALPDVAAGNDLIITGNGDTLERSTDPSTPAFGLLVVDAGASLRVQDLTLENGDAPLGTSGGGLLNQGTLTVENCVITGNTAQDGSGNLGGGGIANLSGTVTVDHSTISNNSTPGAGGGILNEGTLTVTFGTIAGNTANAGGAVANLGGSGTISSSTISGNSADNLSEGSASDNSMVGAGGGIWDAGDGVAGSGTTLEDTTIANNVAYGSGGGIEAQDTVTIAECTIAGNSASYGGGIDNYYGSYSVSLVNTILANNSASSGGPDFQNGAISQGYNLVDDTDGSSGFGVPGDFLNLSADLGPLADDGGPTQTIAPSADSPALAGGTANVSLPAADQRGDPRTRSGTVDIGAYEAMLPSFQVSGFPTTITAGAPGTLTVSALNADGTPDSSYSGTIHFRTNDPYAMLPPDSTLTGGTGTFSATFETAGLQFLTVADTSNPGFAGSESNITVAPVTFQVSGFPTAITAGTPGPVTVTALNADGTPDTGYGGTIHFTSSDPNAVLPPDTTLADGTGTFSATFETAGVQSLTVTAPSDSEFTGSEGNIAVAPAAPGRLAFQAVSTGSADQALPAVSVDVEDAFGNALPDDSTGTVSLSVTGPGAFTADSQTTAPVINGVATFTDLAIHTAGSYQLSASSPGLAGATTALTVNPGAATRLAFVQGPTTGTAGQPLALVGVARQDAFGNITDNPSNAPQVTLSVSGPDGSFVEGSANLNSTGVASFGPLTFYTAGTYTGMASMPGFPAITSPPVTISPAASGQPPPGSPPPANAVPVHFTDLGTAQVSGFLAHPRQFDLYSVSLGTGNVVTATVSAQSTGSGLESVLRVFDPTGHQIALDDQEGGDPRLTFQATVAGDYLIGVSSAGDDAYDPTAPDSGRGGSTTGLYALDLRRTAGAVLTPDLAGSSFRLATTAAAYGDTISGTFTVDNRGGADAGAFDVQLGLSASTLLAQSSFMVLQDFSVAGLAAGQEYSPGAFTVTLPADLARLPFSVYHLGLLIDPAGAVPELNPHDQSGVHRGEDWETLTVLKPVPAGVTVLSQADPGLDTEADGTLLTPGQTDTYTFTVSAVEGSGRLTAAVTPTADTLTPLLTLAGPDGDVLIQSGGQIVQHLQPGNYALTVSARSGTGDYRLTTQFVYATPPGDPLDVGSNPNAVAVADLTGDGIPDIITANDYQGTSTVSVLLGNGDGTFQPWQTFRVGSGPDAVAVADLTGDGIPDIITANGGARTVTVLLGDGNGNFVDPQTFVVGGDPSAVAVADLTGNGIPDLVVTNLTDGTVSVLLGDGGGGFQPQQTYAVGSHPDAVAVADLTGNGIPDIIAVNKGAGTVSVLLGNGDGTFRPQQTFAVGPGPSALAVADLTGDGKLDIITANSSSNTVNVLLGNGDGTFRPQETFPTGSEPRALAVADLSGDGKLDVITANSGSNTASVLLGNGDGTFRPQQTYPLASGPNAVAVADLSGDGIPDVIAASYSSGTVTVLPGNGDGTFQAQQTFSVGTRPYAVAAADLTGDGIPDIITANAFSNTVSVLLGNGDGTFQPQQTFSVGAGPDAVAVADLNGDGRPDIITANGDGTVSVLLGNGDGTFQPQQTFPVGGNPSAVAVADLTGDGIEDIITANYAGRYQLGTVSVLLGNGDGTFQLPQTFPVDGDPVAVAVADLTGDGRPDIITTNHGNTYSAGDTVSVLLGNGDGTFRPQRTFLGGGDAHTLAVADLTGDGKLDIITASTEGNVNVLLGNGNGTFQRPQTFPVGSGAYAVAVADLTGDGKPAIITANAFSNTVSVLLDNGRSPFQQQQAYELFEPPSAMAVADLTGDGIPDVITAGATNYGDDGAVSVLLGNGDGTFQPEQNSPVGPSPVGFVPYAVAVADLNGDGIPDIVTANGNGTVSVLLGNGDGTFQQAETFSVGSGAEAVAVADLNGDGRPDIVTANRGNYYDADGTVSVLLGNGDGTFRPAETFSVGTYPTAVAVADLTGDGRPDIITANHGTYYYPADTVSVLLGNGDGTFQPQQTFTVGPGPSALAVADLNGDGRPDIITANRDGTVSVLPGNGDGTFQTQQTYAVGEGPDAVAVADLTGDGKPDIITANGNGTVSVLLGNGHGSFQNQQTLPVGSDPVAVAVADLTGDGKPAIITANRDATSYDGANFGGTVSVLLQGGDSFTPASPITGVPPRNTPILADLTGDGIADSVVLDNSGNILFRKGVPGSGDQFAPPVILNPGRPARDLALVNTPDGPALAAADVHPDPTLATPDNPFVYTVSLYTVAADGTATRTTAFSSPFVPTRIAAGDLTGDGLDDLVVADSFDNSVQVALQQPDGTFSAPVTLPTGEAPSDISLTDVNGDGLPDIVVTDQGSGDVTVFLNDPGSFATSYRLRAGFGPYGLDPTTATAAVSSPDQPVSLAAGDFTGDGVNDLVVLNRGSDSFTVLPNDGSGGFADPQPALTTSTSDGLAVNAGAGPLVAGYFNGPSQPLDLAVLMPDRNQVWVYTGDGHGHFTHTFSVDAGTSPTGLSVVPGSGPGLYDLLVGDQFGDMMRLVGDGKGDFQPPPPLTGDHTSLAVQTLRGDGTPEVLVANQKANVVTVQAPVGGTAFVPVVTLADGTQSTLAPGAVQWAKLDKDSPYYDAVVVASGANAILVYRGTGFDAAGDPTFAAPVSYPVGTDPVSVTVQDVNGDGIPDMLVADQGSNDVAELFGSSDAAGDWVATPGPRLKSGGSGPVAVSVRDVDGNGIPDLLVTNSQSGTFTVLPGVGQGFFNDQNPQVLSVPGNPVLEVPSFFGTSNLGVVATADGRLIGFNLDAFDLSVGPVFAPPAGEGVAVAEALADGHVVAALTGGEVVDLAPSNGGLVVDTTFQSLTGIPSDPSALAVLQSESGLQVLVTSAGGDRVYVFGIPGLPESPPLPPAETPPGPTIEVTPPSEGSLTLVATLIAGPLPAGDAAAAEIPPAGAEAPAPPADPAGGGPDAGAEEVAAVPGDGSPRPGEGGIDVEEQLRGIDLYQPTPNPERPGLISRRPDGPAREDGVVVARALDGGPPRVAAAAPTQPPTEAEPANSGAVPAEVVRVGSDDPEVRAQAGAGEATDAVFVLEPSKWGEGRWRLLALLGFAGCALSGCLFDPERPRPEAQARKRAGR